MTVHVAPGAVGLDRILQAHRAKDVLRFITCGSVDDGKSTLIGRLLHDTRQLFEDQLAALKRDSRRHGTQGFILIGRDSLDTVGLGLVLARHEPQAGGPD